MRDFYTDRTPNAAGELLDEIITEFASEHHPIEVQALGWETETTRHQHVADALQRHLKTIDRNTCHGPLS